MSPSRQLGPFTLHDVLGTGGFGRVWRATHRGSGTTVAIKTLTPEGTHLPRLRRALATEVRALARLDHTHILRVLDHGVLDVDLEGARAGSPWVAMAYVAGGTLQDVVGRLPWA